MLLFVRRRSPAASHAYPFVLDATTTECPCKSVRLAHVNNALGGRSKSPGLPLSKLADDAIRSSHVAAEVLRGNALGALFEGGAEGAPFGESIDESGEGVGEHQGA